MPQLHVQQCAAGDGLATRCADHASRAAGSRPSRPARRAPAGAERLAGIAVPGVANVHSHAFQRAMAGLVERRGPEDDSFWTWREVMYRFLARMTPDDVEAIAALAYVEMLEAGFTAVGEFHYLHNAPGRDALCRSRRDGRAHRRGGRGDRHRAHAAAVLLRPWRLRRKAAKPGQARFLSDLDELLAADRGEPPPSRQARRRGARHRAAFAARGRCRGAARRWSSAWPAGPIHIHAAEQTGEVEECIAWSGARPVQWLLDNMAVDARWCLIHART